MDCSVTQKEGNAALSMPKLRVATRKSALALAQTTMAVKAIVNRSCDCGFSFPDPAYELVPMTTEGDRRLDKSLASFGGKGVFIKELEIALLEGRADIAIHSLKDMPAEVLPQFKLAAVLKREDPRDAFISPGGKKGVKFMDLPSGARIGTGSIRRVVQLKALRNDLKYVPIRGNIQTRLSKLSELDGIVLAAAGLKRMGLADQVTAYFSTEQMLPASGQGILAIETLKDCATAEQKVVAKMLEAANHKETYCIAVAEMAYLKALDAGCQFPVASFAEFTVDGSLEIHGIYWDEKNSRLLRAEESCLLDVSCADAFVKAKSLGVALADLIKKKLCNL